MSLLKACKEDVQKAKDSQKLISSLKREKAQAIFFKTEHYFRQKNKKTLQKKNATNKNQSTLQIKVKNTCARMIVVSGCSSRLSCIFPLDIQNGEQCKQRCFYTLGLTTAWCITERNN
jgi:hypothetical protein